jgi:putative tricarboxylic transport membrane protein
VRDMLANTRGLLRLFKPMLRGSAIGAFFGVLPGTGQTMASIVSYSFEKQIAREPERFGKGAAEGVASPEASNNAAVQSAFIPTLILGIPGSATMALMMGALMIHGIAPGPSMMVREPVVFWGLIASFAIGNLMLLALNIPLIGIWVWILRIPFRFLYPAIICLICIGAYSVNNNVFDIVLVLLFGVLGYGMRVLGFEPAPLLVGFVLGPMLEENMRRAMLMSRGNPAVFLGSPVTIALAMLTVALVAWMAYSRYRSGRRRTAAVPDMNLDNAYPQEQDSK